MSFNNIIFIILIIFINLTKITKENEELQKDRIFWTIKEIFKSIETYTFFDIYSISLYYLKYKIRFSYLRINNVIEKEINIDETEKDIYSVKNISFNVIYNNYIFFDDINNNNIKYEDLQKQIVITFSKITFLRENDFLFYQYFYVDSIIVPKIEKISKFKFFKDYNEGKVKPFFPDTNKYYNIEEALSWSMEDIFRNKISDTLFRVNLYLYDFNQIMEMSKNISCKNAKHKYFENLDYIYISEFKMSENDYLIYSNLDINYLELKGNFTFDNGDFVEFNAYLGDDGDITMDSKFGIQFYNRFILL